MKNGLGDFIVVRFNQGVDHWAMVAQSLAWPDLKNEKAINHYDISEEIKVAWNGDVSLNNTGADIELDLALVPGQTSISDFIKTGAKGFIGKFARVSVNSNSGLMQAFTDATRQIPLYWLSNDRVQAVATDLRLLAGLPGLDVTINQQAIYHHLNFSYIPTPFTIYNEINKLPAGSELTLSSDGYKIRRYWKPSYPEDINGTENELEIELRQKIIDTVSQYTLAGDTWGSFLSGGTDSSAITGVLASKARPENTNAYSIGFYEDIFDELEYAEIAAKAYGVRHNTLRIGADEALAVIDTLVGSFDEPFGNSSAIPTYYCAHLAHSNNHNVMIAGDGGDEVFGGNERYAKDYYFQKYYSMPSLVKKTGQAVRLGLKPVDNRFANRVKNFLYRGSLPNPERFYTDDSFASDFFDSLLAPDFRQNIEKDSSLSILQKHYDECDSTSDLNRLMYIDLQMAITDNDLSKVNRSAKATGVSVLYPYLSPDLIQYMGKMPNHLKVKGTDKRYLYKRAVKNILPKQIIEKKKQGFGLPVGEWFRHDERFKTLLFDTLLSQKSLDRGYFQHEFIKDLINRHQKGYWDFTQELWLLLMLELWHQEYFDQ